METFCSNTVTMHLLLCFLGQASTLHIMEVDRQPGWKDVYRWLFKIFGYALKDALIMEL